MQPPNIENLFVPGGVTFYFDPGTGEVDLGHIEEPPEVEVKSDEAKVYSNRSGKRRLAKTFPIQEEVLWSFTLQELVAAHLQAFFKGGDLETVNAGTGAVVDQLVTLTGEQLVSLGKYGISAVTVTNLAGDVTYIQNTDYIIDPGAVSPNGLVVARIGRIASGAITNGQQVKVDYTYTTWGSIRFPVANANYQEGAARLQFRPTDGFQWNYIIPKCQLKPNGRLVLDDKKPAQLPMLLEVLDDHENNPNAPYGYWECLNES